MDPFNKDTLTDIKLEDEFSSAVWLEDYSSPIDNMEPPTRTPLSTRPKIPKVLQTPLFFHSSLQPPLHRT